MRNKQQQKNKQKKQKKKKKKKKKTKRQRQLSHAMQYTLKKRTDPFHTTDQNVKKI